MRKRVLLIFGIVIVLCAGSCLACLVFGYFYSSTPEYKATATAKAIVRMTEASKPTVTTTYTPASHVPPLESSTPTHELIPTYTIAAATPLPTETAIPSQTPTSESMLSPTPVEFTPTHTLTHTPTKTPTPTQTPTLIPITEIIRAEIDKNLQSCCPESSLRGVRIEGRELFIMTSLDRTYLDEFFGTIGSIHGTIAQINPDVDKVTIEDITGQLITVNMKDLLAFYNKQITWDEYRTRWIIINP
jgi:hypothetical protein